jgi:hypothetical protein
MQEDNLNIMMGAIYDFNCLMFHHSVNLLLSRWWHAMFYFLVDVAAINTLLLWRWDNQGKAEKLSSRVSSWIDFSRKFSKSMGPRWHGSLPQFSLRKLTKQGLPAWMK